ncbi:TetR/AcrR family transcriptional regulator [Lichenifustis flavocetrariae]|uniref:TetR/AcrR family transcriptional regulator n=1 Tax=Lichenifustis flavocetrariae TaxID=2949735 RepID=A0AA41Z385_9HYPH|nr:TetR/AcrR family transcriptional regulator [Lichenifustis flavocetrariae]MCW6512909.1 TetR/AcrR family transcriptional regulator [Lichenifustis flavocetrariae]
MRPKISDSAHASNSRLPHEPSLIQAEVRPSESGPSGAGGAAVDTILEGATHILKKLGFEGYTTNAIADRAGVSIGSLYQYFPNKDAVTLTLIERESAVLVREIEATRCLILATVESLLELSR